MVLNPTFIQVKEGRIEQQKSSFDLNGSASLVNWGIAPSSGGLLSKARTQCAPPDPEGLTAAFNTNVPIRGLLTGRLDISGTPDALAGNGTVRIENGALADEPFDVLASQLHIAHSVWRKPHLQLRKSQGQMSGELAYDPARHFISGKLQGGGFRLQDFHRLPLIAPAGNPKGQVTGDLNFEAQGQGTQDNFHFQGSWRVQDLTVAATSLGEIHGTLGGEGHQLTLVGENQSAEGKWRLSAHATAGGDWPVEADGDYSSLRADPWIRAFFNREFAAVVMLGGSMHARGSLRAFEKIDIQSHLSDVAVNFPSIQWRNVQAVNVHYADGKLSLSPFTMRGPSTELEIAGTVGVKNGVALGLTAEGTANAALLSVFDAKLLASGRSTLHLRLTGTPAHPLMNGAMDIQDLNLDYNGLPFRFNNLQGTINLEGERAVISSLRGTSGGGAVNINGFVTLVDRPRYEVRADLSQVRVRYPESFTSVFDGNLRLDGSVDRAELQGELVVRQMALNQNVNFISKADGVLKLIHGISARRYLTGRVDDPVECARDFFPAGAVAVTELPTGRRH